MKKVLFIAYLYPPIANSGTQRSIKFVNFLPDFGWEPIVLTVEHPPDQTLEPALLKEVRPGTRIERVPFLSHIFAQKIAYSLKAFIPEKRLQGGLEWRLRGLWRVPDPWALWRPAAVRRGMEILQAEKIDCIYATGAPWTSFLVAHDIWKKSRLPFVIDYRDLWTSWDAGWDDASSQLLRWWNSHLERRILKDATAIVTTTNSFAKVLSKEVAGLHGNVFCITNGFDPKEFNNSISKINLARNKLNIVYTGVWKDGYSPSALYEAVGILFRKDPALLAQLKITCAGFPPGPASEYDLTDIIQERGRVPHAEAIALMKDATALFLPVAGGNYASGSLPGKLFEYLGAERPIIAAVPEKSEVAKILDEVGNAFRVAPDDINGLASIISSIARREVDLRTKQADPKKIACFHRRNLTGQLAKVFDSITENQEARQIVSSNRALRGCQALDTPRRGAIPCSQKGQGVCRPRL